MNTSMTDLAQEYHETADKLLARLTELRAALATAKGEASLVLERRIEALTAELSDIRIVAAYLKNYYIQ